jgi:hypothetical protein
VLAGMWSYLAAYYQLSTSVGLVLERPVAHRSGPIRAQTIERFDFSGKGPDLVGVRTRPDLTCPPS